jgi:hypothetical protein
MSAVVTEEQSLRALRERQAEFAARFGLSLDQYLRVMRSCTTDEAITVFEVLKAKHHQSAYRASMESRIRSWIDTGIAGKPLTPEQFKQLRPTWPVRWKFPTY